MYGDERGAEDRRDHLHKLYARLHAVQCQNKGRILKPAKSEVRSSSHRAWPVFFWNLKIPRMTSRALMVFIHHGAILYRW